MHLKPISYELRRELFNRKHPWRNSTNKGGVSPATKKLLRRKKRRAAKRRKKKLEKLLRQLQRFRKQNEIATKSSSLVKSVNKSEISERRAESPKLPKAYQAVLSGSDEEMSDNDRPKRKKTRRPVKKAASPDLPAAFRPDRFENSSPSSDNLNSEDSYGWLDRDDPSDVFTNNLNSMDDRFAEDSKIRWIESVNSLPAR